MKCKFCACETLMTVRDNGDNIFPCCPCCKDTQNMEKQNLVVHMIIMEQLEVPENKNFDFPKSFSYQGGYDAI